MFVMSISFSEAPGPLTVLHAHVVVHLIIFGQHVCVQPGHKGCHNSVLDSVVTSRRGERSYVRNVHH